MPCRFCLIAITLATLSACAQPQQDHAELQPDQELADEEDTHWGVALALLALQVCHTMLYSVHELAMKICTHVL